MYLRTLIALLVLPAAVSAQDSPSSSDTIAVSPIYKLTVDLPDPNPTRTQNMTFEILTSPEGDIQSIGFLSTAPSGSQLAGCTPYCFAPGKCIYIGCGGGGGTTFDTDTFLVEVESNRGSGGDIDFTVTAESLVTRQKSTVQLQDFTVRADGQAQYSVGGQ